MNTVSQKLKTVGQAVWRFMVKVFLCKIMGTHDWTCAAKEHIQPTPAQLAGGVMGFWEYATTYCKRCKVESRSSLESKARAIRELIHG